MKQKFSYRNKKLLQQHANSLQILPSQGPKFRQGGVSVVNSSDILRNLKYLFQKTRFWQWNTQIHKNIFFYIVFSSLTSEFSVLKSYLKYPCVFEITVDISVENYSGGEEHVITSTTFTLAVQQMKVLFLNIDSGSSDVLDPNGRRKITVKSVTNFH